MKRSLLVVFAFIAAFAMNAQVLDRNSVESPQKLEVKKISVDKELEKKAHTSGVMRDGQKPLNLMKVQLPSSVVSANKVKEQIAKAPATFLEGAYIAKAESNYDGMTFWNLTIIKDETEADKYWISDIFGLSTHKAYGTLSGAYLSIPLGQIVVSMPGVVPDGILCGLNTSTGALIREGNITCLIDEENGFLQFDMGVAIDASGTGFYEAYVTEPILYKEEFYKPEAFYSRPANMLITSVDEDWLGYTLNSFIGLASVSTTQTFGALLNGGNPTYSWEVMDMVNGVPFVSAEQDLSMDIVTGTYSMPKLTVTCANGESAEFTYGISANFEASRFSAGGTSASAQGPSGVLNFYPTLADINYGAAAYRFSEGVYMYGTGAESDQLIQVYEPQSTLYFEGANFYFNPSGFAFPADAELTLSVITCERGERNFPQIFAEDAETVAVSKLTLKDIDLENGILKFRNFVVVDEDGFETEIEGVEMNQTFALVLSGYNIEGATIAFLSERNGRPDNGTYTYLTKRAGDGTVSLFNWTSKYTMYVNLYEGMYSYVLPEKSELTYGKDGGSETVKLVPLFNGIELRSEVPAWVTSITEDAEYTAQRWDSNVTITVEALPADVENRFTDIEFGTYGASTIIRISQSGESSVAGSAISQINVQSKGADFELSYPEGMNQVSVINASGQIIGTYSLTGTSTTIPATLNNGLYILKFNGEKSATVKVLK